MSNANALIPVEAQELVIARPPEIVLEEARRAAVALKEVIDAKPNPVVFNNEKYLEFEDWQTVGRFYGISPRITGTKYVEFGEVKGWEATAEAVQVATQNVVSRAESMCLNDEPKWSARPKYEWHYVKKSGGTSAADPGRDEIIWEKGKDNKNRPKKERVLVGEEPVPLFQLRSMAQTRAGAKAMRQALSWVVVLAGFKPTPAEELDGVIASHQKLRGEKDMGAAPVVDEDDEALRRLDSEGSRAAARPQAGEAPSPPLSPPEPAALFITAEQVADLRERFKKCDKYAEEKFLEIAKIKKLEELPSGDFDEAVDWIARRAKRLGAA